MRRIGIIMLLGLIVGLISCEKENEGSDKSENTKETEKLEEIMPIAEENNWTYLYHNHSYNTTDTSRLVIGDYKELNNYSGFDIGGSLIKSDEKGNTIEVGAYNETDTIYLDAMLYKKDLEIGESYNRHTIVRSEDVNGNEILEESSYVVSCVNKDTLIAVPAGNFKCIVYEHSPDNGSNVFKTYLSIGVGRVKLERFEDGFHFSTTELLEYEIK